MHVWVHSASLLRMLNLLCHVVALFLIGFGPGLCYADKESCCLTCFLSFHGSWRLGKDLWMDVALRQMWSTVLAFALALISLLVLVVLGLVGARASAANRALHPSIPGGVCAAAAVGTLVGATLALLRGSGFTIDDYEVHGHAHKETHHPPITLSCLGWLNGGVCLAAVAALYVIDIFVSFAFYRQEMRFHAQPRHRRTRDESKSKKRPTKELTCSTLSGVPRKPVALKAPSLLSEQSKRSGRRASGGTTTTSSLERLHSALSQPTQRSF